MTLSFVRVLHSQSCKGHTDYLNDIGMVEFVLGLEADSTQISVDHEVLLKTQLFDEIVTLH
jgi:hypothetical protein